MKRYSHNTRWRVKTAEQRYILLVGDILVAGLALFIALEVWAEIAVAESEPNLKNESGTESPNA